MKRTSPGRRFQAEVVLHEVEPERADEPAPVPATRPSWTPEEALEFLREAVELAREVIRDYEEVPNEVMFIPDVMRERKMSRQLVMRAILSGELIAEEHGSGKNKYRIDCKDFEDWRARHKVKP